MPGIGSKSAAANLLNAGDFSPIPTPGYLAAYACIAPVARRSGASVRDELLARSDDKQLKNSLFRSAWVATSHDPTSETYYVKKRADGKKSNAAFICLARRRLKVLFVMVRDGSFYQAASEKLPRQLDETVKLKVASPGLAGRVG